jgi:hypothetical protein
MSGFLNSTGNPNGKSKAELKVGRHRARMADANASARPNRVTLAELIAKKLGRGGK